MIESVKKPGPTVLVIFGAVGDLSQRKLVPALYNLLLDDWLPKQFAMIGVSHHENSDADFKKLLKDGIDKYSRRETSSNGNWENLAEKISYYRADFTNPEAYNGLAEKLDQLDESWETKANRIFYMS